MPSGTGSVGLARMPSERAVQPSVCALGIDPAQRLSQCVAGAR